MSRFSFRSLLYCAGLLGSLLGFSCGAALAQAPNADAAPALQGPEQRVALVIGNANYRNAPQLANPDNDAQSMAQFLNSAGFEVISATDLTQNDMLKVMQDFSAKVAARGSNTVAMIYYAGHGVQVAGENYLIPVDARISSPSDLAANSIRLVDVMATLEAIPSRMRIVLLDACRNNPFPEVSDAGRGLAIVDAPNGSIVGYSTAPGTEALDGIAGHSPYTRAFLNVARQPNLPIEQLFKRVRLEVNNSTDGQQIPWESSSLTSDFTFFGDTQLAATRAPSKAPVVQMASNLPSRSVRQAYDYVLSEGSPERYQEFITLFPHDPLCVRIRWLLANLLQARAWHKAVLANSPLGYKNFYDNFGNSPYAQVARNLEAKPKNVSLLQPTRLIVPDKLVPTLKLTNLPQPKSNDGIKLGDIAPIRNGNPGVAIGDKLGINPAGTNNAGGQIVRLPPGMMPKQPTDASSSPSKIVTLPVQGATTPSTNNGNGGPGKIVTLPVTPIGKNSNGDAGRIVTLPATTIGKTGINRTNGPANRVTVLPTTPRQTLRNDPRNTGVLRLNNNPTGNRPQGAFGPGKMSNSSMNANASANFAQSGGRRAFMR